MPTLLPHGGILPLTHSLYNKSGTVPIPFTALARDGGAVGDSRGWVFRIAQGRYTLLTKTGIPTTALAVSPDQIYLVIAQADKTLIIYNIQHNIVTARIGPHNHTAPVYNITFSKSSEQMLTSSVNEVVLWDTKQWTRLRVLQDAEIKLAMFLGDNLITIFGDMLHIWSSTFELIHRQPADNVEVTPDYLLVCNRSSVFVYDHNATNIRHEIQIPSFAHITQIQWLQGDLCVVLGSNSLPVVIDFVTGQSVSQFQRKRPVRCFAVVRNSDNILMQYLDMPSCIAVWNHEAEMNAAEQSAEEDDLPEAEYKGSPNDEDVFTEDPKESKGYKHITLEMTSHDQVLEKAKVPNSLVALASQLTKFPNLSKGRLADYLSIHHTYPPKYRDLIWKFLLSFPENRDAYRGLSEQGLHPSLDGFRAKFPLKSHSLARHLERCMSALMYWSPVFSSWPALPTMIFPIVKFWEADSIAAFEMSATIPANWAVQWWEYHPNGPTEILAHIEEALRTVDKTLLQHFEKIGITTQTYAWLPMQSLFSDLFSELEWKQLWDHIFTRPVTWFYVLIIAYATTFRDSLMRITQLKDFEFFFTNRQSPYLPKLVARTDTLFPKISKHFQFVNRFTPLTKSQYPIFNAYPDFIENYQSRIKNPKRK